MQLIEQDASLSAQGRPAWRLPRISLVTENLNHGEFLEAMILSALSQDYPDLEYIVIDGGSTDCSVETIRRHAHRLAYWCSEKDAGLYHACNKGFARSTGEVMGYVGSDDILLPGSLRIIGSIMSRFPDIEWLTTTQPAESDYHGGLTPTAPVRGFSRQAFVEGYHAARRDSERGFFHELGWFQQESTFWRRSLWEKAGGQFRADKFPCAADFDLWARFALHAEPYSTPYMLAAWRRRAGQKSARGFNYADETAESLAEHQRLSSLKPNRLRQAALRWGMHKPPVLRRLFRNLLGYTGKRVVRCPRDRPDGAWCIEEYRFI